MELTTAQRRTLEGLIGTGERPVFAAGIVQRVRDRIEETARAFERPEPLWLGKSALNDLGRCPGLFESVRAGERGAFTFSARSAAGRLAHKAVELEVAGREERDPFDLVEQAAERLHEDAAFRGYWDGLDGLHRDETLMDAAKTLELFRSTMPPLRLLRRELAPSTEWHVRAELLGGALVLSGQLDLVLGGSVAAEPVRATRLAIDLKTGRAWPEHAEDMRFYALLLGAPLRCAAVPGGHAVPGLGGVAGRGRRRAGPRTRGRSRGRGDPRLRGHRRGPAPRAPTGSVLHVVPSRDDVSVEHGPAPIRLTHASC